MARGLNVNAWGVILRDAGIIVVLASGAALSFNSVRSSDAISLVAQEPYQILVPCPEHEGTTEAVSAAAARGPGPGVLFIDAREPEVFTAWHHPDATSIPFDYLDPISEEKVRQVLQSRAKKIIVYGDGADPDTGHQLALILSSRGLKNVFFVKGGAPALKEQRP